MTRRKVLFMVLILLVLSITIHQSGLVEYFNDVIHERNGWVKNSSGGYVKYNTVRQETYYYSILKDPEIKEFNIYNGTMKKSAVDRMDYIASSTLERKKNETDAELHYRLKIICQYKNGNVVIIDGKAQTLSVEISRFGFGL